MRAENFRITDGIYLAIEGQLLDLHNSYDFIGLAQDISLQSVTLAWKRLPAEPSNLPSKVCLHFSAVVYLGVSPRQASRPFTEDGCLNSIGYRCDEPWEQGQFWTDAIPDDQWRWSFEFMSGAEIVIGASTARAEATP